jgi:hypothetical protein
MASNVSNFNNPIRVGQALASVKEAQPAENGEIYYATDLNKFRKYENGAWSDFGSGGSSTYTVNKFTLSGTDITNKFVTLSGTPTTPSDTILDVIGGPSQDYSVDFTVTGSTLSWSGLTLDGVLIAGDKLIIQFD